KNDRSDTDLLAHDAFTNSIRVDTSFSILSRWSGGTCRAVAQGNNHVYMGNGLMLTAMNVAIPDSPRVASELYLGNVVVDIKLRDTLAVVVTGSRLYVVRTTNPDQLSILGEVAITSGNRLELSDSLAFVLTFAAGLKVVDLRDPTQPFIRNSIGAGGIQSTVMAAKGRYVYVGNPVSNDVLIYDCTNPDNITTHPFIIGGFANYVYVSDTLLFMDASSFGGNRSLRIFNVVQPLSPSLISQIQLGSDIFALARARDRLYAATRDSGLFAIDVSNVGQPYVITRLGRPVRVGYGGTDLALSDSLIFDAFDSGLWVVRNVLNELQHVSFTYTGTRPGRLQAHDRHIYVTQISSGLSIFTPASSPSLRFEGAVEFNGGAFDVALNGNLAFCLSDAGLTVVDVSDRTRPTVLSQKPLSGDKRSIAAAGTNVYVARRDSGLTILDVTVPSNPVIISSYFTGGALLDVAIRDSFAFLCLFDSGMVVVDISNAILPTRVARVLNAATGVAVRDTLALVATNTGLAIVGIANSRAPEIYGSTPTSGSRSAVDVASTNRTALLAYGGLHAVDITDLYQPREIAVLSSPSMVFKTVSTGNDTIFAADAFSVYQMLLNRTTGVVENDEANTKVFSIEQSFPNPFNGSCQIRFHIIKSAFIVIEVLDILGRKVSTLVHDQLSPGDYTVTFSGNTLSSGVYFYRLKAGSFEETKKFILVR
ncbi:MAG: T9SS type A sorting domain-containing protein, partial [Ignavibacteriae bacterium]|nr:T9SS type A sorting domain-containing protein [Ignavibacteriota bacterium]